MKKLILYCSLFALVGSTLTAQTQGVLPSTHVFSGRPVETSKLPRFDLDFPGGFPQELVDAIKEQITVLNAIIPEEHAQVRLPPLKMQQVNVHELFTALTQASLQIVHLPTGFTSDGRTSFQNFTTSYGFQSSGPVTPETVWHFSVQGPPKSMDTKAYRFYQLAPYLGPLTVEDITTAIQAGWKMMGETNAPSLNYHKETKLLIAVGRPDQLSMINAVLVELPKGLMSTNTAGAQPSTPQPNTAPGEASKTNKF